MLPAALFRRAAAVADFAVDIRRLPRYALLPRC